jgi:PAS domain S-box-containing protein
MTFRRWTILVAAVVAALGVTGLAFDAWRSYSRELAEASRTAQSLVTALGDHTGRTIQVVDQALDAIAADADAVLSPRTDRQDISASFERRLQNLPQLLWFSVFDAEGNLIASSSPEASASGNIAEEAWFAPYLNPAEFDVISGHSNFGHLGKAKVSSRWFIPVTRALKTPDGKLRAVLMAALDQRYFAELYSRIDVREHGNVTLFETDGTIVARFPNNDDFVGRSAASGALFRTHLPQANSGVIRLKTALESRDILLAYRTVADYPLVINVAFDEGDVLGGWRKSLAVYAALVAAIVGVSFAAAHFFLRSAESAKALAVSQKEAEDALARQREIGIVQRHLSNAERIANIGNWHWNIETNELAWSDQIYRIFGLLTQEFGASYPAFLDYVHPEDRANVEEAVRQAVESGAPYAIDHRIVRADGTVRIVHEQGEIVRDPMGRARTMNGVVQDVTELRKAEAERLKSEMRLAGILNIAPEAIIAVDAAGLIQVFNIGAEQIFGQAAYVVIGQPLSILLPERFRARHPEMIRAFGNSTEPSRLMSRRGRISGLRSDGTEFSAEASIAKLDVGGERLFTVILRDITERVEEERTLVAAKEVADAASRAKSEFLANMSHELRTPLNAIIGFSEMMSMQQLGPLGDKRYEEYAADIASSGKHLLDLINDILDVAKIEARQMRLDESAVDLGRTAHESLGFLKATANDGSVAVSVDVAQSMPRVLADERKMKQIVLNLLSNAVRFTPKGGAVTVRIAIGKNGEPTLVVSDTGIGIPLEQLPYIGQPFVQVDGGLNGRFEGTGLGLALSKALTELHGGTLTIESEVGRGTTVTVRLPPDRVVKEATTTDIA